MVLPLAKLRQVPPLLKAALKARSITTCDQLLAVAGQFDDRAALARATRIALDPLTELVRRADLARVKGVGTVFGRMLEDLGIGDVAKLAHQKPGRLHQRLTGTTRPANWRAGPRQRTRWPIGSPRRAGCRFWSPTSRETRKRQASRHNLAALPKQSVLVKAYILFTLGDRELCPG